VRLKWSFSFMYVVRNAPQVLRTQSSLPAKTYVLTIQNLVAE
jgi:hypothetical protein